MYPGTHAKNTPEKLAVEITDSGAKLNYFDLNKYSIQIAKLLRERYGIKKKDVVALLLPNSTEFLAICCAAQRSGLYYCAISTRLTPNEVSYILADSKTKVFFVDSTRTDLLEPAREILGSENVISVEIGSANSSLYDLVSSYEGDNLEDEAEGIDLLYSSGTTGKPKGVKFPLELKPISEFSPIGMLLTGLYSFDENSSYLTPAPLYHAAPLRFSMAINRLGASLFVMEKFDPVLFLKNIEKHKITHTQVVPTMFVRLLKLGHDVFKQYDTSSLKAIIHASAPCPVEVKKEMIDWFGPIIYEYYAGTEGNGFVCCNSQEYLSHLGTVGRPLLGKVHILSENYEELPPRSEGLVYFEGASNFEYLNDPQKTKDSTSPQGYTTLGDIGWVDEEGYLYLTDRKSFMIISGGVNIYPQEVENVLINHPKVLDVAVFGVPDSEMGERVHCVVTPVNIEDAGEELKVELLEFLRKHLASYKLPKNIDFEEELPRHPTGKLYKKLLIEKYSRIYSSSNP